MCGAALRRWAVIYKAALRCGVSTDEPVRRVGCGAHSVRADVPVLSDSVVLCIVIYYLNIYKGDELFHLKLQQYIKPTK